MERTLSQQRMWNRRFFKRGPLQVWIGLKTLLRAALFSPDVTSVDSLIPLTMEASRKANAYVLTSE